MKESIFYYDKIGNVLELESQVQKFGNSFPSEFGVPVTYLRIINSGPRPLRAAKPQDFGSKFKMLPPQVELLITKNYDKILALGFVLQYKSKKLFFKTKNEKIVINDNTNWKALFIDQFKLEQEKRTSILEETVQEIKESKETKEEKEVKTSKYGKIIPPEKGPSFNSISLPNQTLDTLKVFLDQQDIKDFLKDHGINRDLTVLNFFGPPGTGKTLCASALGKKLGMPLMKVKYDEVESKYIGETEKNLRKMFTEAEDLNAILFLDEADSLLSKRIDSPSSSTENYMNLSRNVFMQELDSFKGIVILTTNLHINYDPAVASRISKNIQFNLPNEASRLNILKIHINSKTKIKNKLKTLKDVASVTKGFSGRDLKTLVEETIVKAASNWHKEKRGSFQLVREDFDSEIARINMSKKENQNKEKVIKL